LNNNFGFIELPPRLKRSGPLNGLTEVHCLKHTFILFQLWSQAAFNKWTDHACFFSNQCMGL